MLNRTSFRRCQPVKELHDTCFCLIIHLRTDTEYTAAAVIVIGCLEYCHISDRHTHIIGALFTDLRRVGKALHPVVPYQISPLLLHLIVCRSPVLCR